jgi:hypothetical protein
MTREKKKKYVIQVLLRAFHFSPKFISKSEMILRQRQKKKEKGSHHQFFCGSQKRVK